MRKDHQKSTIQVIQPYCDTLLPALKQRKDAMHVTNHDIADATGISYDFIRKFFAGQQKNPSVYNVMAICIYLNFSLDAHFNNPAANPSTPENGAIASSLEADIRVLEEKLNAKDDMINVLNDGLKRRKPFMYALLILCALLTIALIGYLSFDISAPAFGLVLNGHMTPIALILILLAASALWISIIAIIGVIRRKK